MTAGLPAPIPVPGRWVVLAHLSGNLRRGVGRPVSALRAREAQVSWAAAPFSERAAVMRRAAELWATYSADIQGWLIHESGGTRAKLVANIEAYTDTRWITARWL